MKKKYKLYIAYIVLGMLLATLYVSNIIYILIKGSNIFNSIIAWCGCIFWLINYYILTFMKKRNKETKDE